ncbi:NRDE family protein [Novosphingobium sp. PS1R-30]|uniref:NRDE family protein n=1 Tax=Novosphingobium anseongense TaxID=3133436 RepID=A0ABU8RZ97_9SPHN
MCVAAFAWQAHPQWLFVAIGNRDEFHERPAAPLAAWQNGVLAGRDLRSGGTWLGATPAGRFALVTNLRGYGAPEPDRASRGALVTDLLTGSGAYADPATAPLQDFNPFNLILADRDTAHFLSNRPDDIRTRLAHGIYGLSNGQLDEPWPKTLQLKSALLDWLNRASDDFGPLFSALRNEDLADVGLPPREPSDVPREAPETPVFIRDAVYGTRCSTVVAVDRGGRGTIIERRFSSASESTGETKLTFAW